MLLHLPGGYAAENIRDALPAAITALPAHLRRSLTWDQGKEMTRHAEITAAAGIGICFCDPHSPWQRGTNENTNGLLRQYFPHRHRPAPPRPLPPRLHRRRTQQPPRKTLPWKTPAQALNELLLQ